MSQTDLPTVARPESLAAGAYRTLRDALLRRAIAPGQRLIETELAQQLGVSRTPVRDALARLVAEGMADALPAGGIVVRDIQHELADIYGLRQVLEGYAARLAAARIEPRELERLGHISALLRASIDADALQEQVDLNNAFHAQIATSARSDRLVKMIDDYRAYFLNPQMLGLYDRAAMLRSHQQHEAIVQALRAGDGDAAERLVRAHFHDAMAVVLGADAGPMAHGGSSNP